MPKTVIPKTDTLTAVGPYSLAISLHDTLYVSGQIGIRQNQLVQGGLAAEFNQIIQNLNEILHQAGYQLSDIVQVTVYMADIGQFEELNQIYQQHFRYPYPTRTTVQVAALPLGASLEIAVIAAHL